MATPSSEAAYASLQAYKPRTAEETLGTAEAKYDVGGATQRVGNLRSLVGNLQSAVEAVDPSVTGRTSGTFTTEGQRQALVSRERAPILGDLSKQQGFLSEGQSDLSQSQALASQMASALFNQDQQQYQRLLDQYNSAVAEERAAEARRQFEEQMRLERERLAAQERQASADRKASSGSGGYDIGSLAEALLGGGQGSSASTQESNIYSRAKVLEQMHSSPSQYGANLGSAIKSLREKAAAGDAAAKRVGQVYYQLIGRKSPFKEFQ